MFVRGDDFRRWRFENRVKLYPIAKHCGCSLAYISRFENEQITINDYTIEKYKEFIRKYEKGEVKK